MKLSILIPTYKRPDILTMCLEALERQTTPLKDFEVIVVDDGSEDDTEATLKRFQAQSALNLTVIHQKNTGQGIARNHGLQKATAPIVLFLGDDIIADPNLVQWHLKTHEQSPEQNIAVLGFVEWHPELEVTPLMHWMTNGSSILGKFGGHQFAYEKLQRGEQPDFNFFYTCNLSLKKDFLGENPFDAQFGKYGWEDIELGYRLEKEKGMKLIYRKEALGWHHHAMDERGFYRRMEMIGKSAHLIHKKYPELKKIPGFKKRTAFFLLSNPLSLNLLRGMNKISRGKLQPLLFYAFSKKHFMKGIRTGYNASSA